MILISVMIYMTSWDENDLPKSFSFTSFPLGSRMVNIKGMVHPNYQIIIVLIVLVYFSLSLLRVVSCYTDSFVLICPGFEISVSEILSEISLWCSKQGKFPFKEFRNICCRVTIALDNSKHTVNRFS